MVEVDAALVDSAARSARIHALRGHDAVQCAAGRDLSGDLTVCVSGDDRLLAAWRSQSLAVLDMTTFDESDPDGR